MHQEAQQRDHRDRRDAGQHQGDAGVDVQRVNRVHAQHHELGVADPDHVDDAEDQVEAERQERQHPTQQQAVDQGLEQEDIENFHGPGRLAVTRRYRSCAAPRFATAPAPIRWS